LIVYGPEGKPQIGPDSGVVETAFQKSLGSTQAVTHRVSMNT
jgi:hypothetical protein